MRKVLTIFVSLLLTMTLLPLCGNFKSVAADSYYTMSCDAFEVSKIEDDGSLTKVSCHNSYNDALTVMKTNEDYVIRHPSSLSPTKIVGMNSGIAYTYPGRLTDSVLINLYQDYNNQVSTYKQTYVTEHYEMTYFNTASYSSDGSGWVRVTLNGFEGYAKLQEVDLVPTKYLEKGIAIWLGGNNSYTNESAFLVKVHQSYYCLENNGNYTDLVFHYYRGYGTNGGECLSYSLHCDNAENYPFMSIGTKYYSCDGINFYSDDKLTNYVGTTYNYYQFLPVRSTTNISASTFDSFINSKKGSSSKLAGMGSTYIDYQNKYGVNALIVYAMSCQESAYGTSDYAKVNNLFGWSVYDDDTSAGKTFSSVSVCLKEMMGRNLRWFMDYTNKRYFGTCVGNKGAGFNVYYASDPYWGVKIASIAYSIDKYANGNNGNLSDFNKYTIGLVKNNYNDVLYDSNISWDPNIYTDAYSNNVLYTGRYGSHYQKDLTVILLGETGSRYKIQSTNNVENGQIVTDDGIFTYDWDDSVGYIDKSNVIVLNGKSVPGKTQSASTYDPLVYVNSASVTSDKLTITGVAAIQGMNFSSTDNIKHEITFVDVNDSTKTYTFTASTVSSDGFDMDDGWDYSYAGFSLTLDLPNEQLPAGEYRIKVTVTNRDKSVEKTVSTTNKKYRLLSASNTSQTYKLSANVLKSYALELDVLPYSSAVDFTQINKPSTRRSLVSMDSATIDENGKLEIVGYGLIYNLSYASKDNVQYSAYLVNDSGETVSLTTSIIDPLMDFTKEFSSSYDLTNITFKAELENVQNLSGNYTLYIVMKNGSYCDICQVPIVSSQNVDATVDEKTISIQPNSARKIFTLSVQ